MLKEKAELTDLYDHKYQELTAEKGSQEIELLEQEIAFLTNIEKECQTALADANSVMDKDHSGIYICPRAVTCPYG